MKRLLILIFVFLVLFSIDTSAIIWKNETDAFSTDISTDDQDSDMDWNGTHLFVWDHLNKKIKIYLLNSTFERDINISFSMGSDRYGFATNGSDFWFATLNVAGNIGRIVHANSSGHNQTDGFDVLGTVENGLQGIATNGSDFWITDNNLDSVFHYNSSGHNQTDGFSLSGGLCTDPKGIFTNGSDFWIGGHNSFYICHYDSSGNYISDGINTTTAHNVSAPYGVVFNYTDVWYVTLTRRYLFHMSLIYSTEYTATEIETAASDFYISFNLTNTGINSANVSAKLMYDNTQYAMTKTIIGETIDFNTTITTPYINTTTESKTFYFNFTTDNGITIHNTSNQSQTIYQLYIDACGGVTNDTTLNITFRDEIDDTLIFPDSDIHFKAWKDNPSLYKNYSFNFTNKSSIKFCISPNSTNYTTDYDLQYSETGYDTKNYNARGQTLLNTITYLNLTMLSSGNSTTITITVQDDFGDALSNYIVEAWKYELSTNTYSLVSTEETDTNGQVIMYLNTNKKHLFYVKDQNGNTKYTSDTMTLVSASYTFIVIVGEELIYQDVLDLERNLQVPDEYKAVSPYVINYTWSDVNNLIDRICLAVYNTTIQNMSTYDDACSTADSGTLSISLIATEGYFPIVGYVIATTDKEKYILDTGSITLRTAYDVFNTEGLIYAFLFVGTMAFLSLGVATTVGAPAAVMCIILMNFGIIIMRFMGFFNISIATIAVGVIMSLILIGLIGDK